MNISADKRALLVKALRVLLVFTLVFWSTFRIEMIALGSDFDGIEPDVEMGDCSGMPLLEAELHRRRFSDDEIEKIFHGNALRVLKEFLPEK